MYVYIYKEKKKEEKQKNEIIYTKGSKAGIKRTAN